MMLHAALVQELVVNEKMAAIDGPPVVRKRRTGDCQGGAEFPHEDLGDRADISPRCRVERRTILEIELTAADGFQPKECLFGFAYGLLNGRGTRLECDDDGIDFFQLRNC